MAMINQQTREQDIQNNPLYQAYKSGKMTLQDIEKAPTTDGMPTSSAPNPALALGQGIAKLPGIFGEMGGLKSGGMSGLDELIALEKYKAMKQIEEDRTLKLQKTKQEMDYQAELAREEGGQATIPTIAQPTATSTMPSNIPTSVSETPSMEGEPAKYEIERQSDGTRKKVVSDTWKEWQKARATGETKRAEFNVKKEQLRDDLTSFFAVDDLIDRAKGGLVDTKTAAFNTWWKSVDQPVDPVTGIPDPKGAAANVHNAASKRLRVQLVRAAGDVGNINIIEQEAAEKLIPRWDDSVSTANLKRAYLKQIAKAVGSKDKNEVIRILEEAGVGFVERKVGEQKTYSTTPTQAGRGTDTLSRLGLDPDKFELVGD